LKGDPEVVSWPEFRWKLEMYEDLPRIIPFVVANLNVEVPKYLTMTEKRMSGKKRRGFQRRIASWLHQNAPDWKDKLMNSLREKLEQRALNQPALETLKELVMA